MPCQVLPSRPTATAVDVCDQQKVITSCTFLLMASCGVYAVAFLVAVTATALTGAGSLAASRREGIRSYSRRVRGAA